MDEADESPRNSRFNVSTLHARREQALLGRRFWSKRRAALARPKHKKGVECWVARRACGPRPAACPRGGDTSNDETQMPSLSADKEPPGDWKLSIGMSGCQEQSIVNLFTAYFPPATLHSA
jgi:hypothetical protein